MINATSFLRRWWFIFTWICTITKSASKLNGQCSSLQASLIFIWLTLQGGFLLHKTHLHWATVLRLQHSYWWCGLPYASRCVGTNTERKYIPHAVVPYLMHVPSHWLFCNKKNQSNYHENKAFNFTRSVLHNYVLSHIILIRSGSSEFYVPKPHRLRYTALVHIWKKAYLHLEFFHTHTIHTTIVKYVL